MVRLFFLLLGFSGQVFAAEGVASFFNVYASLAGSFGLSPASLSLLSSALVLGLILVFGSIYARVTNAQVDSLDFSPRVNFGVSSLLSMGMDLVYSLAEEHGGKSFRRFIPLLAGLFFSILISNLSGLVPGFPPATENFNANLAMGLIVFLIYNLAGIQEHGAAYIKQFTGPFLVLAPLFLGIEIVSHAVRPLSLAFRLLANIFCDHLLLGVFSSLVPLFIPCLFLLFGLLVAVVQSFVFTLLTGIYINMAISHDH